MIENTSASANRLTIKHQEYGNCKTDGAVKHFCFYLESTEVRIEYGSGSCKLTASDFQTKNSQLNGKRRLSILGFDSASQLFIIEDFLPAEQTFKYWAVSPETPNKLLLGPISSISPYKNLFINQSIVASIEQTKAITVRPLLGIADTQIEIQLDGQHVTALSIYTSQLESTSFKHTLTYLTEDLTLHQDELLAAEGKIEQIEKHSCQLIPSIYRSSYRLTKLIELSRDNSENHFIALGDKGEEKISVFQFTITKKAVGIHADIHRETSFKKSLVTCTDQQFISVVRRRDSSQTEPRSAFVTILSSKPRRLLTLVIQQQADSSWLFNKIIENACDEEIDVRHTDLLSSLFDEADSGFLPFMKKDCPNIHYIRTNVIHSALQKN